MDNVDMKVKDLKAILETLPDDMDVIIPVIDSVDVNSIYGFRHVETAGILSCITEEDDALCLNSAGHGADISTQVNNYDGRYITCKKVLF